MLERLTTILASISTPAQLETITEAVRVLSENGFKQCEEIIDDEIALCSDAPMVVVPNLIEQRFSPMIRTFLGEMGVTLAPDLTLTQLTEIFDVTARIENFDDQSTLFGLATCEEESVEVFLCMLSLVSAKPEAYFAPMVEDVSDFLISRIAELTGTFDDTERVDQETMAHAKRRVIRLIGFAQQSMPDLYANFVHVDHLKLGCPATLLLENLREHLEEIPDDAAALLICLYVLSSDIPDGQIRTAVSREVETTFTELFRAMAVSKSAAQILARVTDE